MPAVVECRKAKAMVGTAPRVAPTSGMRSAKPTNSPRTPAYGTPRRASMIQAATPAITLMTRLPNT